MLKPSIEGFSIVWTGLQLNSEGSMFNARLNDCWQDFANTLLDKRQT